MNRSLLISRSASCLLGLLIVASCSQSDPSAKKPPESRERKVGVLLVSHGSESENWRRMLLDVESSARGTVLDDPNVQGLSSAFMEYTEPSVATRLKEFDAAHFTDVVIVPILLTVSTHSFDDIPVIAGQREDAATLEQLKLGKIEVYHSQASVSITPLLDFPAVLKNNAVRRIKRMSDNPASEGIVFVAYGSQPYNAEWLDLIEKVGQAVKQETGIPESTHSWCGHIAQYKSEPTADAIRSTLAKKQTALVLPLLVAIDETFQGRIIGGAIQQVGQPDRVKYLHDAILPDENVNQWVIDISREYAGKASAGSSAATNPAS